MARATPRSLRACPQCLTSCAAHRPSIAADSLSAALCKLCADDADDIIRRSTVLFAHYGMVPTRNNRDVAPEDRPVENRHEHVKDRINQAPMLRGSYDFDTLDAYHVFVAGVITEHNRLHADAIKIERESRTIGTMPTSAPCIC